MCIQQHLEWALNKFDWLYHPPLYSAQHHHTWTDTAQGSEWLLHFHWSTEPHSRRQSQWWSSLEWPSLTVELLYIQKRNIIWSATVQLASISLTSQCDGFTEWSSSIGVHCCHLESILSVWSKTINDASWCQYWLGLLHISVRTTGCIIPHNIASDWSILLITRHFSPAEGHLSGLYKCDILWSSWGGWVCKIVLMWLPQVCTFITWHTCCESVCIHWSSRELSASSKPSLVDSESVVHAFLEFIKCAFSMAGIHTALINIGPTRPPVVYVVLLCVTGSHPCQIHWGRRQHSCWEILGACSNINLSKIQHNNYLVCIYVLLVMYTL